MAVSDLIHRVGDLRGLSLRIHALSESRLRLSPTVKRRLVGAGFLIVGAVSAAIAHGVSRDSAMRDWESSHFPSPAVMQSALAAAGLKKIDDVPLLHRTLRELPGTIDLGGSIWVDPSAQWVVVFRDSLDAIPADLFRWEGAGKLPPKTWDPLGRGWLAFDGLLRRLQESAGSKKVVFQKPNRVESRDPREIRY